MISNEALFSQAKNKGGTPAFVGGSVDRPIRLIKCSIFGIARALIKGRKHAQ
jgi:hypothetical protein